MLRSSDVSSPVLLPDSELAILISDESQTQTKHDFIAAELVKLSDMNSGLNILKDLGFSQEQAEIAFIYGRNLDGALEFMLADRSVQGHSFFVGDSADTCAICFLTQAEHTNSMLQVSPIYNDRRSEAKEPMSTQIRKLSIQLPVELKEEKDVIESAPGTLMCGICFCEVQDVEVFYLKCSHYFCRDCLGLWIQSQVNDGRVGGKFICCPKDSCKAPLETSQIQELASSEIWTKFQRFLKNIEIEKDPNARWCVNNACDNAVFRKQSGCLCCKSNDVTCDKCQTQMCFNCGDKPHGIRSRCQNDREELLKNWRGEEDIRQCPVCKLPILRVEGCNHMTCSCGAEFCWICGAKYTRFHFVPWNIFGCPGLHFSNSAGRCLGILNRTLFGRILWRFVAFLLILIVCPVVIALQFAFIPFSLIFFIFIYPIMLYRDNVNDFAFGVSAVVPCLCCYMGFMEILG